MGLHFIAHKMNFSGGYGYPTMGTTMAAPMTSYATAAPMTYSRPMTAPMTYSQPMIQAQPKLKEIARTESWGEEEEEEKKKAKKYTVMQQAAPMTMMQAQPMTYSAQSMIGYGGLGSSIF